MKEGAVFKTYSKEDFSEAGEIKVLNIVDSSIEYTVKIEGNLIVEGVVKDKTGEYVGVGAYAMEWEKVVEFTDM